MPLIVALVVLSVLLSGCFLPQAIFEWGYRAISSLPSPAAKSYLTRTPLPWPTFTPQPGATPYSDDYQPELYSERKLVPEGFFTFLPLKSYLLNVYSNYLELNDISSGVEIYAEGFEDAAFNSDAPELIAQTLLANYFNATVGEIPLSSQTESVKVDGVDGIVYHFAMTETRDHFEGNIAIFPLGQHRFVTVLGVAQAQGRETNWAQKGAKDFRLFIESFKFVENTIIERSS